MTMAYIKKIKLPNNTTYDLAAAKLNTNAGTAIKPVYFSNGVPVACNAPASGAWWNTVSPVNSNGVLEIGQRIDFHCTSASTNDYDVRLDTGTVAKSLIVTCAHESDGPWLTVQGKLPKLKFIQTTTGYEYNRDSCGITAYPGTYDAGLNLVMQSGGNTIISSGEAAVTLMTSLNNGDRSDINKYPYHWRDYGEQAYVASDENVNIWTNGASWDNDNKIFTDLHCFTFNSAGNFSLAVGGGLYFRYGTRDENGMIATTYNSGLLSAATTAQTWTLPNATGTIALVDGALKHILTDPSSDTNYGLTCHASSGVEGNKTLRTIPSLQVLVRAGTTTTNGFNVFVLGNSTATGTAGNKYGGIRMYTVGTAYLQLAANRNENTLFFKISDESLSNPSLAPFSTNKYDLGTTSYVWRNVYADSFVGPSRTLYAVCTANGQQNAYFPYHRIAYIAPSDAIKTDHDAVVLIESSAYNGNFGILKISMRINDTGAAPVINARWLVRAGWWTDDDAITIGYGGVSGNQSYADVFIKCGTYPRLKIYLLTNHSAWTFVSSTEVSTTTSSDKKTSVEVYKTIAAAATELHNQAYTSTTNAIDPVDTSWTTKSYTEMTDSSKLSDGLLKYRAFRLGSVEICGYIKPTAQGATNAALTLVTLSNYKPSTVSRYAPIYNSNGSINTNMILCIDTNGVVKIQATGPSAFSSSTTYYFNLVYFYN